MNTKHIKTPRSRIVDIEGWACEPVGFITAAEAAEAWGLPPARTWDRADLQEAALEIAHTGIILVPFAGAQVMAIMAPLRAEEIEDYPQGEKCP